MPISSDQSRLALDVVRCDGDAQRHGNFGGVGHERAGQRLGAGLPGRARRPLALRRDLPGVDRATVSVTATASGISGTVTDTQNAAVVATFTIDPFGFGTISYSNGSTAQIEDFVILG